MTKKDMQLLQGLGLSKTMVSACESVGAIADDMEAYLVSSAGVLGSLTVFRIGLTALALQKASYIIVHAGLKLARRLNKEAGWKELCDD